MTAQRRGPLLRAAVVGALVSGAVLLPAAPALADVNANPGSLTLNAGEEKQISVTVTEVDAINPEGRISVSGLGNEVSLRGPGGCSGNGSQSLNCQANAFDGDNDRKTLTITISAKRDSGLQPGQTRDGSVSVDGRNGEDSVNVVLRGPQQAASASEVSGKVTDTATGDGVPGAQVTLKDSAGNTHDATANNSGNYSIKSSSSKQIVPGQVTVTAVKEGYADTSANGTAQAGKALNLGIRMKPTAASAEPSAPVASEPPAQEPSTEASGVATPQNTSGEDEGTSMLSWLLIGMGILLVLLGIGAIVLLVMRRKDDGFPEELDGYGAGPNEMAPAGAGAYRGGETMVGGRSTMNDATAIVGPQQLDEFPDPYAAPPPAPAPTRVGGAYSGGYDDSQATNVAPPGYGDYANGRGEGYGNGGGYRDERGYGGENPRGGYDDEPRGGGYGGGDRYADQPTGVYQGGDQGGYPAAGGGYGGANGSEYGANGSPYGGGQGGHGQGGYGANGSANGGANGGVNGYGGAGYEGDYGRGEGYPAAGGGYAERNGRNRSDWQD